MDTLNKQLKALEKKRAKVLAKIQAQQKGLLLALPGQVGLGSVAELITALQSLGKKAKGPKATKTGSKGKKGKRTRAVITDATRAEVKKLVTDGKSGSEIAAKLGISLPSVHNIKKALGLVKARK